MTNKEPNDKDIKITEDENIEFFEDKNVETHDNEDMVTPKDENIEISENESIETLDNGNIEVLDKFEDISSIDDENKIPLTHIKRMRKKDAKIQKFIKTIVAIICFILVFTIGFSTGFYYGNKGSLKIGTAKNASQDNTDTQNQSDSTSTPPNGKNQTTVSQTEETKMLEGLKTQFVNRLKTVSPGIMFSFGIKNLRTGQSIDYNNLKVNSAGVINLFIMETVYKEAAEGNYDLTPEKEDALFKMITNDDNNAAAMFIDEFGGTESNGGIGSKNSINMIIKRNKYTQTELNGKLYTQAPPEGFTQYTNYTGVNDTIKLLEGIYSKTLFEEPYNTKALNLLKSQSKRDKIPAKISENYPDISIACKTGELAQSESDVALIMCNDFDLAFAIFVEDIPQNPDGSWNSELHTQIRQAIAEVSLDLVRAYKTNKF